MSARFEFTGLEELKVALRRLPEDLRGEASHLVEARANRAAADIRAAYPHRTGNLRRGVVVELSATAFSIGAIVRNTAKHAFIFENGTQARHTKIGANRGAMPPGHVFVPLMMRHRREMYANEITDLLVRNGLLVRGTA